MERWAPALEGYAASEIIGSLFSKFYSPDALKRGLSEHELRWPSATARS